MNGERPLIVCLYLLVGGAFLNPNPNKTLSCSAAASFVCYWMKWNGMTLKVIMTR